MSAMQCGSHGCTGDVTRIETVAVAGGGMYTLPLCSACYAARCRAGLSGYTTRDTDGIISRRVLVGIKPDGKVSPGAWPWHWCYGSQPVFVKGAVYQGTNESAHLVRGITEAEAQRRALALALDGVTRAEAALTGLSRSQIVRRARR